MPGAVAKTKKATNILRPAIDVTFDKDAEFDVFFDSRRFFHGFFLEKVTLYGEVAIKSRYLEAKSLKFSQPPQIVVRDRRKSLGVPSNLIWVLGDFDKIFRINDFVW